MVSLMYLMPLRELRVEVLFILWVWVGSSVGMLFPDSYMLIFCIGSNTSLTLLSNICCPLATQVIWHYLGLVMSLLARSYFAEMSQSTAPQFRDQYDIAFFSSQNFM